MSVSDEERYAAYARSVTASGILTDPWVDGAPRFREEPIVLTASLAREMERAAEKIGSVYNEMVELVSDEPPLLDDFFCLTPVQKALWMSSAPLWHGVARADVFRTREGLQIAELNCDTPTGEPEAIVLGALAKKARPEPEWVDPNASFEERFLKMIDQIARTELAEGASKSVGIVYPTEFTEDLSLVRLYRKWLESRGQNVVLGSPYNLAFGDRGLTLFDEPIGLVLRHYKSDWWAERSSAWVDEELPDQVPLVEPIRALFSAMADGKATVVNPFGAALPQNKRSMAFFWEHIHRFSTDSQRVIEELVPYTIRLESMHEEQITSEQEAWVLKSDYGAEGEEVILGKLVSPAVWRESLLKARVGRWVAQRYFEALSEEGGTINYGVYLIAGEASGMYARLQAGPTDGSALSVPLLVQRT